MTNIVFSPALQAPITLAPPSGPLGYVSDPATIIAKSSPVPGVVQISLVGAAVKLALAMSTNAGGLSVSGTTPTVISGVVTPRVPSTGTVSSGGSAPNVAITQTAVLSFPRIMGVFVGGDQSYGRANGYPWTTAAAGSTANAFIQNVGAYDIAILSGAFEGWDSNGTYDRENLTQALLKNGTYSIKLSQSRRCLPFYYQMMMSGVASGSPYQQFFTLVQNNNWWLYETAGGVGTITPAGGGANLVNYSAAWPGAIGSAGIGASICGSNYGTTSAGSPTGAQGPARTMGNYVALKYLIRNSAGIDTRFSFNPQMASPSCGGMFLDNCFVALDGSGAVPNSSLDGITIAPGSQVGVFPALDTVQPVMARGNHNVFDQMQTMAATYQPGSTFYNFANFGMYANKYQFGTATLTAGLENTLHGGLLENSLGAGSASWECYQTGNPNTGNTTYASGWPNLLANYYQGMDFCLAPKMVGLGTKLPATDGSQTASWPVGSGTTLTTVTTGTALEYQLLRYGLCTTLLDDGYFAPGIQGYDYSKLRWYDEYGDDSLVQVNVKRGYLGTPLTTRPTSATWAQGTLGVWSRSFTNGIAIVNPRGNGAQTINLGATYQALNGTQQPTINNGALVTSVTLADGDGRILLGPYVDPYATRGPQAGDVWVDSTASVDGSGTQASPWKVLTVARVQAMKAGQALWVKGIVQWPDVPIGTGPSGTASSRIMCKAWPGFSGTFNFPQIRTPGIGTNGNPGSAASSGGGYYWDWVGLGITCLDSGLYLGDVTGGTTNASHFWRFIDCVGVRSGSTYTDNQGVIYASQGVGIQIIRGSYSGPSGESGNQCCLFFDYPQDLLILGVLVDQSGTPIYFKHTLTNSASTPGGTVQNCIIRRGGRGFQASLNYVNYINNVFDGCSLGIDESGGGVAGGNNCTIINNTFWNSNVTADITDSGTHTHFNNTLTSNVLAGASQWEDDPSGSTNQLNVIDYSATSGTATQHYQRNHTGYNTPAAYHAVYSTQEIHGLNGTIQFVGGASGGGTTAAGWALVAGSFGTAANGQAGLNGADRGVNASKLLTVN